MEEAIRSHYNLDWDVESTAVYRYSDGVTNAKLDTLRHAFWGNYLVRNMGVMKAVTQPQQPPLTWYQRLVL